ncbi:fimbrial protein [Stenotrophomonas nematodicola]|uniref:Fimbrial protein n=1 Tax=Stenotrophomonas nematodicola TaxID=2656746 RepID=A0ABW7CUM7_9GAMM
MKRPMTALLFAALLLPVLASANTIDFDGELVASTCSVTAASKVDVKFGNLDVSALSADGNETGRASMPITMNCPGTSPTGTVAVRFESPTLGDNATGNLRLTAASTARNVQIGIDNAAGTRQIINGLPTADSFVPIITGTVKLDYTAVYVAVGGPAGAGTAKSNATFTVAYP